MLACSSDELAWLRERWRQLALSTGAEAAAAQEAWTFIEVQYAHPSRCYHNLSHIHSLLRHADELRPHIAHEQMVELAIWFHDVIYDTNARDNERRSARWARQAMESMRLESGLVSAVEHCILATQKHEMGRFDVPDLPLFLDLDLAILGAPEEIYRQYSHAVRQEYDWVLEPAYRFGRRRVLNGFLQRPRVFFTTVMADRFEGQARRNMEQELIALA
jgi:predicted metal-dependent HD superfamily phosphohydrolase